MWQYLGHISDKCVCIRIGLCAYVHVNVHVYVSMSMPVCFCTCVSIYIYMYLYVYTYTYAYLDPLDSRPLPGLENPLGQSFNRGGASIVPYWNYKDLCWVGGACMGGGSTGLFEPHWFHNATTVDGPSDGRMVEVRRCEPPSADTPDGGSTGEPNFRLLVGS